MRYDPIMETEPRFVPKGAIAFFVAMIVVYAAIWFGMLGLLVARG